MVVYDLLSTPDQFVAHFERYAASVVSIVGFARRISDSHDPLITEVIAHMQTAAHYAVVAKDFPRIMETFPCELCYAMSERLILTAKQGWRGYHDGCRPGCEISSPLTKRSTAVTTSSMP